MAGPSKFMPEEQVAMWIKPDFALSHDPLPILGFIVLPPPENGYGSYQPNPIPNPTALPRTFMVS